MTDCTVRIDDIVIPEIRSNAVYTPESWKLFVESCKGGIYNKPKCRTRDDGRCELVDGLHRIMAWKELGHEDILVDSVMMTDAQALAIHLVGNHQRGESDPVGMARVIHKAHTEQGMSLEEIGKLIGYSATTCKRYEIILMFPEEVQQALTAHVIGMGHLDQFARLEDEGDQKAAFQFSIQFGWTVQVLKFWVDARIAERQQVYATPEMTMGQPIAIPDPKPELAQQRQCLCCGGYDEAQQTVFWQMCHGCADSLRYLKTVDKSPWNAIQLIQQAQQALMAENAEQAKKIKEMEQEIVTAARRALFGSQPAIPAEPKPANTVRVESPVPQA